MRNLFLGGITLIAFATLLTNCSKDDNDGTTPTEATGDVRFEITDAPIDDTNVEGCFVTVTAVKVDGEVISNFSGKQTIDLLAFQNGNVKSLGFAELEAGTYSNVALVLDYESDVNGNSPGCYVQTTDNVKHDLQASANSANELTLSSESFTVEENGSTNIVMDFDVRKAVKRQEDNTEDKYDFVTESELKSSVRVVKKDRTGKVKGKCNDNLNMTGRIVVYAYKKGTYSKNTETTGQGSSQIMFKNATSSAVVDGNGNYTLAFLEEGDYELHFFGYEDSDNDGEQEIQGELQLSILGSLGLDLNNVSVDANAELSLNVDVTGIIPL
jgi:hypothetical protein